MLSASGAKLDAALAELGWAEMLTDMPEVGLACWCSASWAKQVHTPRFVNDVLLETIGGLPGGTPPMPSCRWHLGRYGNAARIQQAPAATRQWAACHCGRCPTANCCRISEARRALGWWLVGSARGMLALARQHALDRVQFGKPISSFQAVRHRLAETLVAIEGAEADAEPA